jgi:hypothetical protein
VAFGRKLILGVVLVLGIVAAPAAAAPPDTTGLVDPASGEWHLRNEAGAVASFFYGDPGDLPMMGDWDCDGIDTPGLYRRSDGFVYLRNTNTQGPADVRFVFGNPGDLPLAGDFNDDGCDTVAIYRPSEGRVFIINELGANDGGLGTAEADYLFGNPGDKPFVGDFDGDGVDTVGLHRESTGLVYVRNSHTSGVAGTAFIFGDPGDRLVAGDWGVGTGVDTPAVFRPAGTVFFFRHRNSQGVADAQFTWGQPTWLPIAGTFDEPAPEPDPVVFTVAGDLGATDATDRVLAAVAAENADFHLAVGDLSYAERSPESAWCDYVKGYLGDTHPIEILVGNHEDDHGADGFIRNFTPCLPDRMGATGDYGVEYLFDTGAVRVIMIAAGLTVDGVAYNYTSGARHEWLMDRIAESKAAGSWTVVGFHKNCITAGAKSCEIGETLLDDMITAGVDLIVQGHEHNYQRSHQLSCVDPGITTSGCIADADDEFVAEAGTVVAISGWVGRSGYDVDSSDDEAGYFAVIAGPNTPGYSEGYLTVTASPSELVGVWTSVDAPGTDRFTIRR